jgi:phospholipase/carboxylesterase
MVTQMPDDERGGTAVLLLHGYGAQADDLVSLARSLQRPRTRFILPAAPLSLPGGGRAWWDIEAGDRPRYVTDEVGAQPPAPNSQLEAARRDVQAVLARTVHLYAPEELFIVGFSQGAMLSLDVALAGAPSVQRVGVLSGALLTDAVALLDAPRKIRPAVFISHGREDTRLPFFGAERMKSELEERGFSVTFEPFSGGHEIPEAVVSELRRFLFG